MTVLAVGLRGEDVQCARAVCSELGISLELIALASGVCEAADHLAILVEWPVNQSAQEAIVLLRNSKVPVVVVLERYSGDLRAKAFSAGAYDVICSPINERELRAEIRSLLAEDHPAEARATREFVAAIQKDFVGSSPSFLACVEQLRRATLVDSNVLLLGETGTGKEVFARALHKLSYRAAEQYVGLNCAAIPDTLLESELFGSRKGSFSGAENRMGLLEAAGGGTVLLDEIGELPLILQAKLLRVVQEREFRPLGLSKAIRFSGRVVAATLVDLREAVRQGQFRSDLLERLDQVRIVLPPLRDRREDIPMLARYFLERNGQGKCVEISTSAMQMLLEAEYPRNIRQLENAIGKALIAAAPETTLLPRHLPKELFEKRPALPASSPWRIDETMAYGEARDQAPVEVDRVYLARFMRDNSNKKIDAARAAGIDRKTFSERWNRATGELE